tara:strand:- start:117 stop:551 length:435 start_codon:yes stop_codon:yes gene_type:complete
MKLNFTEIGSSDFEPIPEGRYNIKVQEAKTGTSGTGNPKIDVTYELVGVDGFKGRKVWHTFSLQQKALFALKNFLTACESDVINKDLDAEDVVKEMVGLTCSCYITPATSTTGKPVSRLSNFVAASGATEKMTTKTAETSSVFK